MTAQVTVRVRPAEAAAIRGLRPLTPDAADLQATVAALGGSLLPVHPPDDPVLASYFVVDVNDSADAERAADRLRQSPAVEAAYVKPADAAPR
jgi:hypothetical protein